MSTFQAQIATSMFVDHAEIYIKAGDGGAGCSAFLRERFRPHGGPSGGNGGNGGNVYAVATQGVDTLLDFTGKYHWPAENGRPGEGKDRIGRNGRELVIELPVGTMITDRDTGLLIKDLTEIGERVLVASGGRGGRGNASFATPTHQAPTESEPGEPGQERNLRLELKLIADVGFVGLPNAGKSTLLAAASKAHPKIAAYPFTTLKPQLGIVELSGFRRMVLADIPGLIEGAHEGQGLGDEFLRHIERTRVIVHMVDIKPLEGEDEPIRAYEIIRGELSKFSQALAEKPEIVVANKVDLDHEGDAVAKFRKAMDREVLPLSAAAHIGIKELLERLWTMVQAEKPPVEAPAAPERIPPHTRSTS